MKILKPGQELKLYLIESSDPVVWDEYSGFVVVAESPAAATQVLMEKWAETWGAAKRAYWSAQKPEYLGLADPSLQPSIILESFNAG